MTTFPRVWGPNVIAFFDFNSRVFNGISFSRDSIGTYIDDGVLKTAAVNEPRYEDTGLLVEAASTNYFPRSAEPLLWRPATPGFNRSAQADGVSQAITGIFVSTSAATATDQVILDHATTITANNLDKLFVSLRVKGNYGRLRVRLIKTGGTYFTGAYVDLLSGLVTAQDPGIVVSVFNSHDGYLLVKAEIIANSDSNYICQIRYVVNPGAKAFPAGSEIRAQMPQFELGMSASSFIQTTASPTSRAADVLTLTSRGAPKRVYREYTPLGSTTSVTETVPYTGVLCPPGNVRVIKVLND